MMQKSEQELALKEEGEEKELQKLIHLAGQDARKRKKETLAKHYLKLQKVISEASALQKKNN